MPKLPVIPGNFGYRVGIYTIFIIYTDLYPNYLEMQASARREVTIFKAWNRRTSHSSPRVYNEEDGYFSSCPEGAQAE